MDLARLSDRDLHQQIMTLISEERHLLTKILHHLKEIERRRLFSDFGCSSMFDYALKMLGYSEGQAQRRIQAMRLLKDFPEIEKKIADGVLSLSNIAQAQTTFNELKRQNNNQPVAKVQMKEVLSKLENLSAREGQRELLKILPEAALPKERERPVDDHRTEIKFVMDEDLRIKLEEIRSMLGPDGAKLSYADLFSRMAEISLRQLKAKAFGKKRAEKIVQAKPKSNPPSTSTVPRSSPTPTSTVPRSGPPPTSTVGSAERSRYISASIKHLVWERDSGRCRQCGGRRNLNYDHIVPFAKNGPTTVENLRLLCFPCNQRAAIRDFGLAFVEEKLRKSG